MCAKGLIENSRTGPDKKKKPRPGLGLNITRFVGIEAGGGRIWNAGNPTGTR